MTFIVTLTGGIGSGKTLISDHFETLNVPVIDTDVIAREIVAPGTDTLTELTNEFGKEILLKDGSLNRDVLRKAAFESKENKEKLDQITHPAIRDLTFERINQVESEYCVVVVPLLLPDSEFAQKSNRILLVTAPKKLKIQRVEQRSGLNIEEIEKIMESQLDDYALIQFVDDVIINDGTIRDAHENTEDLHEEYFLYASEYLLNN